MGGLVHDIEAIRKLLPHRYPFLLVDRIEERSPERVVGLKNVTANEPFFQGHFPAPFEAIMPGVLILEAMAQTTAFLVAAGPGDTPRMGYLVGIDRAKFRRKVVPGDQLRIEAVRTREKRGVLHADVQATVEGDLAAVAEITIVIPDGTEG